MFLLLVASFSIITSSGELFSKWLIKTGVLRYPAFLSDNYLRLKAKDQQAWKYLMGPVTRLMYVFFRVCRKTVQKIWMSALLESLALEIDCWRLRNHGRGKVPVSISWFGALLVVVVVVWKVCVLFFCFILFIIYLLYFDTNYGHLIRGNINWENASTNWPCMQTYGALSWLIDLEDSAHHKWWCL